MYDNWKEYYEMWYDVTEPPTKQEICPLTGVPIGQEYGLIKALKCECGMNAVYGNDNELHAEYCPLYK